MGVVAIGPLNEGWDRVLISCVGEKRISSAMVRLASQAQRQRPERFDVSVSIFVDAGCHEP
jgi:hypothetical protein